jgi:hypothetical protein
MDLHSRPHCPISSDRTRGCRDSASGPCSARGQTEEVEGSKPNFTRRVSEDVGQEARAQTLGPHDLDQTHQPLTKIIAKTEERRLF